MPRQDSLNDQMIDVMAQAVEMGCYDAHDWLLRNFGNPRDLSRDQYAQAKDVPVGDVFAYRGSMYRVIARLADRIHAQDESCSAVRAFYDPLSVEGTGPADSWNVKVRLLTPRVDSRQSI